MTQGPWEVEHTALDIYAIKARTEPDPYWITIVHDLDDANLMAAAPDLLAAVKLLLGSEDPFEAVETARRAIVKAEGRHTGPRSIGEIIEPVERQK